MSDQDQSRVSTGPVMLSMTSALKPPPARIAKLGNNLVLPRSIPLLQGAAGVVGALVGLTLTAIFVVPFFGATLTTFGLGAGLFGALGVLVVSWSPLRGESFGKWIGLNLEQFRLDRVEIDGLQAKAFIGIAPLHCSALGTVHIAPGAAEVMVGSVDDRGVLIPHAERRREFVGDRGGRLPGAEEGFDRPRWLAEGEASGDARRLGLNTAQSGRQARLTFDPQTTSPEMAPPTGLPVKDPSSRWGAPAGIEHPGAAVFESEKRLPNDNGRHPRRTRKR